MPCAEDLIHNQGTILRMMTVLEGREKSYRKEFRNLLGLIDYDIVAKLRAAFKASLLDYPDRTLEIYDRLKPTVSSGLPGLIEELVRPDDPLHKAVKPLLPGARFYGREKLTDLNTVRGANVVWLQVNAMSHKYYYRIIDAARKHDIPVRYFGSSSAKKCAVQLVLEELAAEKSEDEV